MTSQPEAATDSKTENKSPLTGRKLWTFRLVGVLFAVAFTFVLLEIGARIYIASTGQPIELLVPLAGRGEQAGRAQPHPFLPYSLRPNSHINMISEQFFGSPEPLRYWSYSTNADGFRGDTVPLDHKADNEFRFIVLGGSATFGEGVNDEDTWAEQLEALLQAAHPELQVEALNFGIPVGTSAHAIVFLALRGVHFHPDLVIFYEGQNDLSCCLGWDNFRTDYSHRLLDLKAPSPLHITLPEVFYNSYGVTVLNYAWNRLLGADSGFIDSIPQERSDNLRLGFDTMMQNLLTLRALASSVGAEFIVSTYDWYNPRDTKRPLLNEAIREFASAEGLHLVDQDALIPDGDGSVHYDDVHYTVKGNQVMAQHYFDYIEANGLIR